MFWRATVDLEFSCTKGQDQPGHLVLPVANCISKWFCVMYFLNGSNVFSFEQLTSVHEIAMLLFKQLAIFQKRNYWCWKPKDLLTLLPSSLMNNQTHQNHCFFNRLLCTIHNKTLLDVWLFLYNIWLPLIKCLKSCENLKSKQNHGQLDYTKTLQ